MSELSIESNIRASVCMATFNGVNFLNSQVISIINQLNQLDEFIVADDGSSDLTAELLDGYQDSLVLISTERVGGVVKNFERIMAAATNDIIVLSDQDDVWSPGRLDRIRSELEHADLLLLNAKIVDENLNDFGKTLFDVIGNRQGFLVNFFKNGYVGCCMAFRRELLDLALPFPKNLPWHDWYIGLIGEVFFRVKRIEEPYLLYRRHGNNFSETGGKSKYRIYKKISMRFWMLYAFSVVLYRRFKLMKR